MNMRLLEKTDASPLEGLLHKLKYAEMTDPDAVVCCAACLWVVTAIRHRVEIQGANEHTYINPHGFRFHIICYREAPARVSRFPCIHGSRAMTGVMRYAEIAAPTWAGIIMRPAARTSMA